MKLKQRNGAEKIVEPAYGYGMIVTGPLPYVADEVWFPTLGNPNAKADAQAFESETFHKVVPMALVPRSYLCRLLKAAGATK